MWIRFPFRTCTSQVVVKKTNNNNNKTDISYFKKKRNSWNGYNIEWLGRLENQVKAGTKGGKPQLRSNALKTLSVVKWTLTSTAMPPMDIHCYTTIFSILQNKSPFDLLFLSQVHKTTCNISFLLRHCF